MAIQRDLRIAQSGKRHLLAALCLTGLYRPQRISAAARSSLTYISAPNAPRTPFLFLVLASADRELIIDIGEDGDVGVDPSGQAAAKLQPSGLA